MSEDNFSAMSTGAHDECWRPTKPSRRGLLAAGAGLVGGAAAQLLPANALAVGAAATLDRLKRAERDPAHRILLKGGIVLSLDPKVGDFDTGDVLMMAWMNREAFEETLRTGRACYYSRSRNRLWRKGEESGHVQEVRGVYVDCDGDTLLLKVHQIGAAACHEGYRSCFFRQHERDGWKVVGDRVFDPKKVYQK